MCNVGMGDMDSHEFGAPDFQNAMFSTPNVEVSTSAPHRINFASTEWLDLFQFSREEIAGRSLRIVFGPCTYMKELQRVIETAKDGKEAQATITCYSSSGQGKVVVVKATPIGGDGETCKLTMLLSDAISFKDASMDEDAPRAIISLGQRNVVEYVNSRFSFDFGIPGSMAVKALRMIQGPRTDASQFMEAMNETKSGFVQSVRTYVYSSECKETLCDVRFQPLLGNNGVISHLMALFLPINEGNYGTCSFDMSSAPAAPSLEFGAHQPAQAFSSEPAMISCDHAWEPSAAAADPFSLPAIPESPNEAEQRTSSVHMAFDFGAFQEALVPVENNSTSGSSAVSPTPEHASPSPANETPQASGGTRTSLKLVPRKKRDFSGKSSGAFELTTEKLREMGRISMKQAAHELGIAPSTLKKACRKLGVERWPHGSHGGTKSKGSMDYDGSYVRRLFAKYSRKAEGAPSPDHADAACSPCSSSDVDAEDAFFHHDRLPLHAPHHALGAAPYMDQWQAAGYDGFGAEGLESVKPSGYHCQVECAEPHYAAFQPAPCAVYGSY